MTNMDEANVATRSTERDSASLEPSVKRRRKPGCTLTLEIASGSRSRTRELDINKRSYSVAYE